MQRFYTTTNGTSKNQSEFLFSSVETVSRRRPESKLPAFERDRCGTGLRGSWLLALTTISCDIRSLNCPEQNRVHTLCVYAGMPHRNRKLLSTPPPSRPAPPLRLDEAENSISGIRLLKSKPILSWQFMLATRTYAYWMSLERYSRNGKHAIRCGSFARSWLDFNYVNASKCMKLADNTSSSKMQSQYASMLLQTTFVRHFSLGSLAKLFECRRKTFSPLTQSMVRAIAIKTGCQQCKQNPCMCLDTL